MWQNYYIKSVSARAIISCMCLSVLIVMANSVNTNKPNYAVVYVDASILYRKM